MKLYKIEWNYTGLEDAHHVIGRQTKKQIEAWLDENANDGAAHVEECRVIEQTFSSITAARKYIKENKLCRAWLYKNSDNQLEVLFASIYCYDEDDAERENGELIEEHYPHFDGKARSKKYGSEVIKEA